MKTFKIYFAGKFHTTDNILKVENPYTNEFFAQTYIAGKQELEQAILAALAVEEEMKFLPSFKKYDILRFIANELEKNKDYFAEIIALEAAKPHIYALGEVKRAIQTFTVAAEETKRLPKEYVSLDWTAPGTGKEGLIKHFPIGLIAGIAPFNFPLNLAVHKLAPAIAAGNPIILKPSRNTPLSTLALSEIFDKSELPKGAVSVIPMDRQAGNQLVTDERFKLISFTGSPQVGWKMKHDAGKKKVLLELGGNAGVIVSDTADVENAVNRTIVGGFAYSGQVCIHAQRIYVHKNIFDDFSSKFVEKAKKLRIGNPLDPNTEISAMIDEANAIRVQQWVDEAVTEGAKILCGAIRNGTYYEPTVLTQTRTEMKVCALEVFGPVVTLEPIDNFEQGIDLINQSQYGLQAGIFTNNYNEINYAFNKIEAGGVIVNDVPTFRVDHMPYGGVKNSGFGREGVKYSIIEMMEPKLLVLPNNKF
ncbi:MAG: aldehyde dehydrogenase family protein [Bacteroidales bacterium]|nr:aldehyde dehydrogenase family protein [Bacteroidales bacterium]